MYTVREVSRLAGVSVRTLHYYDEIDLLKPSKIGTNGYRYYDDDALLRLQQVMFYREMDLPLMEIKALLDQPDFDQVAALHEHRAALQERIHTLQQLVQTVEDTLSHLKGEKPMSERKLFKGFNEVQQQDYEREIRLQYDADKVNESVKRWGSYSTVQKEAIMEEGNSLYRALAQAMQAGAAPDSDEVQKLMVRWHNHIRYFYEPTLEILRGLGSLYTSHPDFIRNFEDFAAGLAGFMETAIEDYVDTLETLEIERLLAEDENDKGDLSEYAPRYNRLSL